MCWTYSQRTPCCRLSVRVLACTSGIDMPWASVFGLQSAARTAATLLTLSAVCHLLCANPLAGALVVPFKDLSNLPQLSTVPAGLIRKRGVLALGEALLVLLTPHLDTTAQPHLALAWAIRFAAIAALNYSLLAQFQRVWHPFMLLAELLLCAPLAIWWANFARQYKKPLTGSIKTATEYLAAEEPPAAAQQPQAAPTPQSCPASLRYLLRASAALSALGFAMVVVPRLFIDGLVDTQHLQLPSLLQAADASAQLHPKHIAAIAKVQLITCRHLTRLMGAQLLTGEAIPLVLLSTRVASMEQARKVVLACLIRASLGTLVAGINAAAGGWRPASWADAVLSAAFALAYAWQNRNLHRRHCAIASKGDKHR